MRLRRAYTALALLVVATACGGGDLVLPSEVDPAAIVVVAGEDQTGAAGAALGQQIRVRVTDADGRAVPGVSVAFEPVEGGGGGSAAPGTAATDNAGIATTTWTLGGSLGAQSLEAKVAGSTLSVRVTAMAVASGANRLVLVAGDDQSAPVATALADSLVVRAEDNFGNPVAGVTVDWAAAGGGEISPTQVVTGIDGRAAARRILGSVAGAQSATATSEGLTGSPVEFSHTAVPGTASSLVLVSGSGQTAGPGETLAKPLVVRIVDAAGNPIPSQPVAWVIGDGGGTVSPETSLTDDEGFASTEWTLGPNAGSNTLNAVASGVGVVAFTATATQGGGGGGAGVPSAGRSRVAADPASIQAVTGTSTITVTVLDGQGDPVAGATVVLSASGSGNTLTQPLVPTDENGVAIGSLSSTVPGTKVVSAVVNGSVAVNQTVQVNVTVAPATRVELLEGDGQTAEAGTAVPVPPAVRVTNELGQPVAGFGVTFVVTGGGGSVTGATQTTNSDGVARVGSWTLGPDAGTNTLEARAGSLAGSPVVFTAQATASPEIHFEFTVQPPSEVEEDEVFSVEVTLKDQTGATVPLSGVELTIELLRDGNRPSNRLEGDRTRTTVNGVAVFDDLEVTNDDGNYRLRVRSSDIPEAAPVLSIPFDVD